MNRIIEVTLLKIYYHAIRIHTWMLDSHRILIAFTEKTPVDQYLPVMLDVFRHNEGRTIKVILLSFDKERHAKFTKEYQKTEEIIQSDLVTKQFFEEQWKHNALVNRNSGHTLYGFAELERMFDKGMPVAVVGAGPSLDKNIRQLHHWKGYIFCVDAALKPLLKEGIQPDAVFCVDSQNEIYKFFADAYVFRLTLVCSLRINPAILDLDWQKRVIVHDPDLEEYIKMDGIPVATGPAVTMTAYDVASKLGLWPITLVGNDFAYTGGHTYCRGVDKRCAVQLGTEPPTFKSFRERFNYYWKVNGNLIDTTESGVTDGMPTASFKAVAAVNHVLRMRNE